MLHCIHPNRSSLGHWFTLCVGLVCGMVLAFLCSGPATIGQRPTKHPRTLLPHKYSNVHFASDQSVAQHMRQEIRILCWIMTGPQNHQTKAQHIRHTWGRHCNTLLFMTSAEDPELENTIPLPVEEGRDYLWAKTKEAFKYIYDNHRDDADWFLKADDDSYVVMENLRSMVHPYPSEMPIFFGRKFNTPGSPREGYMSGGAGYVLSKRAMTLFVEDGLKNASICYEGHGGAEDLEMGKCLHKLGVVAGDSRDGDSDRFFPFEINYHLEFHPLDDYWYFTYCYYFPNDGMPGVTANAVSFHYVTPQGLYMYDYFIYTVRTFGSAHIPMPVDERKYTLHEVNAMLELSDPFNKRINVSTTSRETTHAERTTPTSTTSFELDY